MRRRDALAAAVGVTAATALAGGIAWAAIPGDGGVIQGCYDSGGNVKVVAALPCPKGYTPLAWSQQGPKGDKGEQGDPGNLALAGRSCPSGSFLTGFDSSGDLVCATPGDGSGGGGDDGGGEPGELLVSPLELAFPQTPVGTFSDNGFITFENRGAADAVVTTTLEAANATDFLVPSGFVVPAQGATQQALLFSPTDVGLRTATMIVQLPNGQLVAVELSGTGV
jgi:hypothetical protein